MFGEDGMLIYVESSAQNALNYNRPTVGSLQAWADAVNDTSYTWANFLPFFEKSLNYSNPDASIRASNATVPYVSPTNQSGGPLQVSFPNWASPLSSWAQLAFRELGIADVHSLIEGQLIGSQYSPLTLDPSDQTRSSSQTSFLNRAFGERSQATTSNLKVYTHTLAKKILFNTNKTAVGVEVHTGPIQAPSFILSARNEVIVSAGAFQSPQLLMVSGIGPVDTLTTHNIPVVVPRAGVGQNMWDHVVLSVGQRVNVETFDSLMNTTYATKAEESYAQHQRGILTNDQSDYLAWEKLPRDSLAASTLADLDQFPTDWPEVEYEVSSAPFGTPSFSTSEVPIDVGYIQPVLLTPFSRGNVSIASPDMNDAPLINPNWLTHPTDQHIAVAAFKRARAFFTTSSISPLLLGQELLPGPQDLPFNATDSQILRYLQANIGFNWHASCTCRMGREEDAMAVVDSKARVIGVKGLRVVDASAFPMLLPGHPQAVVYALAEKIAWDVTQEC
jgi:choline dehydrogenase